MTVTVSGAGEGFSRILEAGLGEGWNSQTERVRGLYAGDYFYLSSAGKIVSYDMAKNMEVVQELIF